MTAGGASASDRGRELRRDAAVARATRQAGGGVRRGQSETAFKRQAKAWEAGSVGEARAARHLDLLKRYGYTTLHDVLLEPGKKWNLDHLVIGPAGIFFVDAKNWRGTVTIRQGSVWRHWYAGRTQGRQSAKMDAEVDKVRGMASHASARLGAKVTPVICLAGAKSRHFDGAAKVNGVWLVSVDQITPWLRDSPPVLAPDLVAAQVAVARKRFPPATTPVPEPEWRKAMRS